MSGAPVRLEARVGLNHRAIGVWEPVGLEVVDAPRELLPVIHQLVEGNAGFLGQQVEGIHTLHFDFDNHAERAHTDDHEAKEFWVFVDGIGAGVAVGVDKRQPSDRPRKARVIDAGAVGRGGDRPRQRLRVHITLIGQGKPEGAQKGWDIT